MNKCPKCGTEFEGKFCPACGEKLEEEKICPKCGAKLPASARFCNECGYAFFEQSEKKVNKPQTDNKQQLYFALKFVPFAAIAVFSVLLFIIYATPVVEIVMGMGLPNESFGNVYAFSNFIEDIPQLKGAMITLFVFLALSVIYSCIMCIAQFAKKFIYKDINIGEQKMLFNEFLGYTSFVFYAALLIIGISIISIISSADEGMGLLTFGACPILLIVFSIIFTLIPVGAIIARHTLAKKHPEFKKEETKKRDQYFESENLRKEQFYATHTPPVEPVKPTAPDGQTNSPDNAEELAYRRAAVVYKHEKRRYENAIEKPTPAAVIWFDLHKEAIIWISILLTITIILTSVLVSILTNKFRVDVVKDIQLGYTQEQVSEILGEPNDISNDKKQWKYYSSEYKSILGKIKKNNKQQEKALEKGNESELLKLVNEEEKLNKQLENVTYNFIEIKFEGDEQNEFAVSSVYLEKNYCNINNTSKPEKEVKKVESSSELVFYYSDLTGGQKKVNLMGCYDGQLYYSAYYKGGAFYRAYLKNETSQIDNENEITIKWTDKFASYEMTYEAEIIGEINADGKWTSRLFFDNKFLQNYYNNESNWQNDVLYLGDLLYDAKTTLSGDYTIPDSVKAIDEYAFCNCTSLTSITIPDSVKAIDEGTFSGCTSLESITIPNSVKSIGKSAFSGCTSLESITIPSSITAIGAEAFDGCKNLKGVYITDMAAWCKIEFNIDKHRNCNSNPLYYAHKLYLNNNLVTEITADMLQGVKEIKVAFSGCTSLTSVTIPNSVTSIGEYAFCNCTSLTSITIPNKVTSIGYMAFYNCTSLENITIPNKVTSIGVWAFEGCKSLESITIPNSVRSIASAFYRCTNLKSVTFENPNGWKVSSNEDMSNAKNVALGTPTENATLLTDTYGVNCYWHRYGS